MRGTFVTSRTCHGFGPFLSRHKREGHTVTNGTKEAPSRRPTSPEIRRRLQSSIGHTREDMQEYYYSAAEVDVVSTSVAAQTSWE